MEWIIVISIIILFVCICIAYKYYNRKWNEYVEEINKECNYYKKESIVLDDITFDNFFAWNEIENKLYTLKIILPSEGNIYIIVRSKFIHNWYTVKNGKHIEYENSNIDADRMFGFEITSDIHTKGKQKSFVYPNTKGIITLHSKDILSVISKKDLLTSYYKIKINNELIMDFDFRDETYEKINKIKVEERLEREERELRERILAKERKKAKEKAIYNQLLDEGLIYPDESNKRPPIPREVVDAVWRRDKGQCVYCGSKENLHLDHIIPFSKGGATNFENLQLLCQKCNLKKSNKIG